MRRELFPVLPRQIKNGVDRRVHIHSWIAGATDTKITKITPKFAPGAEWLGPVAGLRSVVWESATSVH